MDYQFKLSNLAKWAYAPKRHLVEAALLFSSLLASIVIVVLPINSHGSFEVPATALDSVRASLSSPLSSLDTEATIAIAEPVVAPIAKTFFGEAQGSDEAKAMLDKQMAFVSSRKAYLASLAVIENNKEIIRSQAKILGVPEDVAIGVAFLENGGSTKAKSPAGALGIYQLMPRTARNLGLTVNKSRDDRLDPVKSTLAGLTYLKQNYIRFGDWGLATWAYHAGEGNVAKALQIYALEHDGIKLPGVTDAVSLRNYVEAHHMTIYKLLSDARVKTFTDKLHDDSAGYPYKVVATATLFRQVDSI